jgi:methylated-DNA-[protein]-cysteine S-methyltransferase
MPPTHTVINSPIGELTLVAVDGTLSGVYFPGHWTRPDRRSFGERSARGFDAVERQLAEYFSGERTAFSLVTKFKGGRVHEGDPVPEADGFQRAVWDLLDRIPYGQTTSYGDLASQLGDMRLARAVGHAVGHNPLSIIVPCHRVVGKNGALTGYAGGLERKRFLLELEGAVPGRPEPVPSLF